MFDFFQNFDVNNSDLYGESEDIWFLVIIFFLALRGSLKALKFAPFYSFNFLLISKILKFYKIINNRVIFRKSIFYF